MGKAIVPYQHQVELDACLTGCGAVAGEQFYAAQFPVHVLRADHTIAHLELLNIVVAIKVWRRRWSGWTVQVFCDNLNTVHVLQSGRSRDHFMRSCAREVFLHTAACDIDIQVCHRPGLDMVWTDASPGNTPGRGTQPRCATTPISVGQPGWWYPQSFSALETCCRTPPPCFPPVLYLTLFFPLLQVSRC